MALSTAVHCQAPLDAWPGNTVNANANGFSCSVVVPDRVYGGMQFTFQAPAAHEFAKHGPLAANVSLSQFGDAMAMVPEQQQIDSTLPPGWTRQYQGDGRPYYVDSAGNSQWHLPEPPADDHPPTPVVQHMSSEPAPEPTGTVPSTQPESHPSGPVVNKEAIAARRSMTKDLADAHKTITGRSENEQMAQNAARLAALSGVTDEKWKKKLLTRNKV
eukprot:SAG31_NODE_373_length_16597_cov_21.519518_18_plen_216_part_00